MKTTYPNGSGSVVALAGHPLHPMIVPLPIGAFVTAFGSDVMYVTTGDLFWATASFYLIAVGLVAGAVAAALGIAELASLRRARTMGLAWAHGSLNVLAMAISLANLAFRQSGPEVIVFLGLAMSGLVTLLIIAGGWLGGELTFRHGVGVSEGVGAEVEDNDPELTPAGRPDDGKS